MIEGDRRTRKRQRSERQQSPGEGERKTKREERNSCLEDGQKEIEGGTLSMREDQSRREEDREINEERAAWDKDRYRTRILS